MGNIYIRKILDRGSSKGIHLPPETIKFLNTEKGDLIFIAMKGKGNNKKLILSKNKKVLEEEREDRKEKNKNIMEITEAQILNIIDHLKEGNYNHEIAKKLIKNVLSATKTTIK